MPEILIGGELGIDTLGLKDDSDASTQSSGLAHGVEAGNRGAAGSRHHERRKNAKQSCLAAAVRPEQTKKLGGANVERDAVEGGAVLVAMDEVANGNDGLACGLSRLGGGSEVNGG